MIGWNWSDAGAARMGVMVKVRRYDQEKWDEAIADWRRVVSKYPNNDWSSMAQKYGWIYTPPFRSDNPNWGASKPDCRFVLAGNMK